MGSQLVDLWPKDIASAADQLTPVAILRQQASLLGQKTQNIVEAQVETKTTDFQRLLQHQFYLVAPALGFYRYLLFRVEHHVAQWYPLEIIVLVSNAQASDEREKKIRVKSEKEFMGELQKIFMSEKTKKVIQSMIAQSVK
ncbi:MAG: hypothetical protein L0229_07585 [Blastocatellia bacterium]|nr:hypothetical protein [Blastocatellia bacterium]